MPATFQPKFFNQLYGLTLWASLLPLWEWRELLWVFDLPSFKIRLPLSQVGIPTITTLLVIHLRAISSVPVLGESGRRVRLPAFDAAFFHAAILSKNRRSRGTFQRPANAGIHR